MPMVYSNHIGICTGVLMLFLTTVLLQLTPRGILFATLLASQTVRINCATHSDTLFKAYTYNNKQIYSPDKAIGYVIASLLFFGQINFVCREDTVLAVESVPPK